MCQSVLAPALAKWKTAITDNFCQGSAEEQSESLISGYDYDAKWCNFSWLYVPVFILLLESPQSIDFNSLGNRDRGALQLLFPSLLLFGREVFEATCKSCSNSWWSDFAVFICYIILCTCISVTNNLDLWLLIRRFFYYFANFIKIEKCEFIWVYKLVLIIFWRIIFILLIL